jgi:hypothetical protein
VARKQKESQSTTASAVEPPKREVTCSECGHVGQAGNEVVPYSFSKGDYRWLCWSFSGRPCLKLAWQKFTAAASNRTHTSVELREQPPSASS